jgi:hypothetical protein
MGNTEAAHRRSTAYGIRTFEAATCSLPVMENREKVAGWANFSRVLRLRPLLPTTAGADYGAGHSLASRLPRLWWHWTEQPLEVSSGRSSVPHRQQRPTLEAFPSHTRSPTKPAWRLRYQRVLRDQNPGKIGKFPFWNLLRSLLERSTIALDPF